MKIVITDAQTVTNGDIDLHVLEKFGELTVYPLTNGDDETIARVRDADIVLLNKTVMNKHILTAAKKLKYIGLFATGYNVIDTECCRERGICVCNAGSYSTNAVAQTVFGFLLNHYSKTAAYSQFVCNGGWMESETFSPFIYPTAELCGKTLGIVGYGSIGRAVAKIANAFDMNVLVYTRTPKSDSSVAFVDFKTLLAKSDAITVHCPLNPASEAMFNHDTFAQMKDGAYFINTARGGVLVEADLRDALDSGKLSGAGIDVLLHEPMQRDCPLFGAKNITFTPHVAWAPFETRVRLMDIVCDNLDAFLKGNPKNRVV